jgi:hypothetical protein
MQQTAIQTLIAAGESQTVGFKTSFDKASIESLSSLRNKLVAEGFYLTGNIEKYGSEQPESALPMEAKVLQLLSKTAMNKQAISTAQGQKEVSGNSIKLFAPC